jgi:FMN reductase
MRPLFGFFQALTLPVGVYASDTDFDGTSSPPSVKRRSTRPSPRSLPLVTQAARQRVSEYVATW